MLQRGGRELGRSETSGDTISLALRLNPVPSPPFPFRQLQVVCGNAILNVGELCDDGNTDAGDGCSPVCDVEASDGFACTGPAIVFTFLREAYPTNTESEFQVGRCVASARDVRGAE